MKRTNIKNRRTCHAFGGRCREYKYCTGMYDGRTHLFYSPALIKCWRMSTGSKKTADETGIFIHSLFDASDVKASCIDAAIISSVVPDIMYSLMFYIVIL